MTLWIQVGAVLAAYLVGSLSFAVIVSQLMGLNDPRSYGSKNPGATNVLRSGSKKAAILTLLLDAFKGWLPVALVLAYGPEHGWGPQLAALAGLAAFLGHLYPVFFGFAGGKGVAMPLTADEMKIAQMLAPKLNQRGLFLVGLDLIGGYLTEINVTSPTCFVEITEQSGFDVPQFWLNQIEKALS